MDVASYMNACRGSNRASHLTGSSVHNQRIERLHRDTTRCCLSTFIAVFYHLEGGLSNTHEQSRVVFLVKTTRQAEVGSWFLRKRRNRKLFSEVSGDCEGD